MSTMHYQIAEGLPETMPPVVGDTPEALPRGLGYTVHRAAEVARNAFYGAAVAFEITPLTDEGTRAAAFAATHAVYGNSCLTAAVMGATTFAIEATSSVATANLLGTPTGQKVTAKVHRGLAKLGLADVRTNTLTESAAAFSFGVPLTMALKQQQDPSRTREQNKRYGYTAAAGVSAAVTLSSFMAAEGVSAVEGVPQKIAIGALALAGLAVAAGRIRKRIAHGHVQAGPNITGTPARDGPSRGYRGRHKRPHTFFNKQR